MGEVPLPNGSQCSTPCVVTFYSLVYLGIPIMAYDYLVGGFNPSEKYEFVSWVYNSHHMET